MTARTSPTDAFGAPMQVTAVDGTGIEYDPEISQDGLELLYGESQPTSAVRVVTRTSVAAAWSTAQDAGIGSADSPSTSCARRGRRPTRSSRPRSRVSLGEPFDSGEISDVELSADGHTLYVSAKAGTPTFDLYVTTR